MRQEWKQAFGSDAPLVREVHAMVPSHSPGGGGGGGGGEAGPSSAAAEKKDDDDGGKRRRKRGSCFLAIISYFESNPVGHRVDPITHILRRATDEQAPV